MLRAAGFVVREEPFAYSAFPGRWATPLAGVIATTTILAGGMAGHSAEARALPLGVLVAGCIVLGLFVRATLGDAVLDLPIMRAAGTNLVATRGQGPPAVWLVAHLDSKSQPIPTAGRMAGIALLGAAVGLALVLAALQLGGVQSRTAWWVTMALAALGAPGVVGATVGSRSPGAVDNASGVAAVLEAAGRMSPALPVGVLLPSAEELGLAGARAWARAQPAAGVALNCDGVDDAGPLVVMYSGRPDRELLELVRQAAPATVQVRRMPLGLLTDSVALASRGWRTVTVSRGGYGTLARVHSTRDTLDNLTGRGIDGAATLLSRAAEALA